MANGKERPILFGGARALGSMEGGYEMALSDKDLKRLATEDDLFAAAKNVGDAWVREVLLELRASRKVVRAASKLMRCDSFESDEWFGCEAGLMATLDAYDKARKGKVTT